MAQLDISGGSAPHSWKKCTSSLAEPQETRESSVSVTHYPSRRYDSRIGSNGLLAMSVNEGDGMHDGSRSGNGMS